jgi:hypothetical protein
VSSGCSDDSSTRAALRARSTCTRADTCNPVEYRVTLVCCCA